MDDEYVVRIKRSLSVPPSEEDREFLKKLTLALQEQREHLDRTKVLHNAELIFWAFSAVFLLVEVSTDDHVWLWPCWVFLALMFSTTLLRWWEKWEFKRTEHYEFLREHTTMFGEE